MVLQYCIKYFNRLLRGFNLFSGPRGSWTVHYLKNEFRSCASVVWHLLLPLINSSHKTEEFFSPARLCFLKDFFFPKLNFITFFSFNRKCTYPAPVGWVLILRPVSHCLNTYYNMKAISLQYNITDQFSD